MRILAKDELLKTGWYGSFRCDECQVEKDVLIVAEDQANTDPYEQQSVCLCLNCLNRATSMLMEEVSQ